MTIIKNVWLRCLLGLVLGCGLAIAVFWLVIPRGPKIMVSFLKSPEENLDFTNARTNVLILGIGGGTHEGADLTDTIIFTSTNIKSGDTVMISVPRDIWLESLQAKVNSAYHYGQEQGDGAGFSLAKNAVGQIVGQKINYTFLLDFQGFVEAVNLVAGISVNVDRVFDDYKYPIPGKEKDLCAGDPEFKCRYEHLHFDAGTQTMDGETALKYVRSRNAEGEEGTDFSRSQRQQKVLNGLKDKIISAQFLTNPGKWNELITLAGRYIKSDPPLEDKEIAAFANLLLRFFRNTNQMRTLSLDTGSDENPGLLINPPLSQYGQWVLVPSGGNWDGVHRYIKDKIEKGY